MEADLLRRAHLALGGWPGLFFILLFHFGQISALWAVGLALAYAAVHLISIQMTGQARPTDWGLTFFLAFQLGSLIFFESLSNWILGRFFFFSLYSALFLTILFHLWARLLYRRQQPGQAAFLWACLFLVSALLSLKPGVLFKVAIPAGLVIALGLFSKLFWIEEPARPAAEAETGPGSGPGLQPAAGSPAEHRSGEEVLREPLPQTSKPRAVLALAEEAAELGPVAETMVIQGSPKGRADALELILDPFIAGLKSGGSKVEVVYLRELDLAPCQACFDCWTKTPGQCRHQDQAAALLKRLVRADLVVLAQPLFLGGLPGLTRVFFDRLRPLWEPWLTAHPKGGTSFAPRQARLLGQRVVLLASGALPEAETFKPLEEEVRALLYLCQEPLIGQLIRPAGDLLRLGPRLGAAYKTIMAAFFQAGVEAARLGRVRPETELAVKAPFFEEVGPFRVVANLYWETWQEYAAARRAGIELPEFDAFVDRDVRLNLASCALTFDPARAGGWQGGCQFLVSGRQSGQWCLKVEGRRLGFHEGWLRRPDLVIHATSESLVALIRGELEPTQALAQGLLRLEGEAALLETIIQACGWGKEALGI